jgi:enterochelin esterase family protein
VGEGYQFTDAACGDRQGNFYFADLPPGRIYRVGVDEPAPKVWLDEGLQISGMAFGADGRLYAATQGNATSRTIVAIDPATKDVEVIATEVQPNDLAVSRRGWVYFTDTEAGTVLRVPTTARGMSRPPVAAGGIAKPNGLALSPDQRFLLVSEYGGSKVWSFAVNEHGALTGGERLMTLELLGDRPDSGGDGMTVDDQGRSWITSHAGIQVFDAAGRLSAVLSHPHDKSSVSCDFAGPQRGYLYVCSTDKVFRRRTLARGAER